MIEKKKEATYLTIFFSFFRFVGEYIENQAPAV